MCERALETGHKVLVKDKEGEIISNYGIRVINMGQGKYKTSLGRQNFGLEIEAIQVDKLIKRS